MKRDDCYRGRCERPEQYDAVIDWIAQHNPYAAKSPEGAEDFAINAVHGVIRDVLFGDAGAFCTAGMAIAVRVSSKPDLPGFNKVILAIVLA